MTTPSPAPFPMPPSLPGGMRLEVSRARLLPGAQEETERGMAMLHERYQETKDPVLPTLRKLRAGPGTGPVLGGGEGGSGLDLSNPVDAEHEAFAMRCEEPGWEELRPVLLLVLRPLRPAMEEWARDGGISAR